MIRVQRLGLIALALAFAPPLGGAPVGSRPPSPVLPKHEAPAPAEAPPPADAPAPKRARDPARRGSRVRSKNARRKASRGWR